MNYLYPGTKGIGLCFLSQDTDSSYLKVVTNRLINVKYRDIFRQINKSRYNYKSKLKFY